MELYFQSWLPEGPAKANVVLIHGFGEHSGRYPNVVNKLVPEGFAIYSFDHRGHGHSAENLLAHVNSWSEYLGDVDAFLNMVRQRTADLPLFLMGHSMGGLIVLGYALDHPQGLKGVIASGPAVGDVDAPKILLLIGRIFSRILPSISMDSGLNVDAISRDPEVVKAYAEDPLVFSKASARWSTELTSAIERARARASQFQLPLLIIHGEADTLVPQEGSRFFFDRVQHEDKERIVYEGGYHEPHNDIQFEQVTADLLRWLEDHL
jgi:alpha-beta hydrolase superfamily lysophospholipase